jgi:endonuclease/exonuclease/phosphatase family metal-dependent hydrolase
MRSLILILFLAMPTQIEAAELRVVTFNVLVDWETKAGVPAWEERREAAVKALEEAAPDIVAFQETSPVQMAYFQKALPGYATAGVIPIEGEDRAWFTGKFPPMAAIAAAGFTDAIIFYRKAAFEKLDEGWWWLSSTPEKASMDFGNPFPRAMVWARLNHKATGRELVAVCTHFDNTMPSQVRMAAFSHEKLQPFIRKDLPVIFAGDFNTNQQRGDYEKLVSGGWKDAYTASPLASEDGRDDNAPTINGADGAGRIDHIFYHGDALEAVEWHRLDPPVPEVSALSDHIPVFARFRFESEK